MQSVFFCKDDFIICSIELLCRLVGQIVFVCMRLKMSEEKTILRIVRSLVASYLPTQHRQTSTITHTVVIHALFFDFL